jgi:hypothetical protein
MSTAQTRRALVTPDRQPGRDTFTVERLLATLREIDASALAGRTILLNDLLCAAWPTLDSQNQ